MVSPGIRTKSYFYFVFIYTYMIIGLIIIFFFFWKFYILLVFILYDESCILKKKIRFIKTRGVLITEVIGSDA